jgi:uncharacterized protein (DUF983 family)
MEHQEVRQESSGRATIVERPFGIAFRRALRCRCPACGNAPLFDGFLTPADHCRACGQSWRHQRADDFPAYIVILLLGHILVPIMVEVNIALAIPMGVQMALWPGLALVLALVLIRPAKAAVIAFQWSRRMHGFGAEA